MSTGKLSKITEKDISENFLYLFVLVGRIPFPEEKDTESYDANADERFRERDKFWRLIAGAEKRKGSNCQLQKASCLHKETNIRLMQK